MNKDYILHKWLNGSATIEEVEYLKSLPEYASYIKISEASSKLETPIPNSEGNFEVITSKLTSKGVLRKLNPFTSLLKIAAVLAVLLIGYLYIDSLDTTIQTQIAEKQTLLLPDTSEVAMNANSSIVFNKKNWDKKREITLEGEAYFKITKGNTFNVNTPSGIVSVLGTQFNIFVRNNMFNVSCYEGLVSVTFNDTLIKLPAGSKLKIENGVLVMHTSTNNTSPSWTINESSFDNETLVSVLKELENQYPITITAQISNANPRFTGSFTHNNLNLALKSICDPLHLAYTIKEESVTIYAKEIQ
jgi:transmembrane sensor